MNLLTNEDKRTFERIAAELSSNVMYDETIRCETTTVNVSNGGALLNSPAYLAKDLSVKFSIRLEDNDEFQNLRATVLRVAPILGGRRYAIAVGFEDVQERLTRAVKASLLQNAFSARKPIQLSASKRRSRTVSRVSSRLAEKKWAGVAR